MKCFSDLRGRVAVLGQARGKDGFFDVAVAQPVGPVAQVAVAEFIAKQSDDAALRGAFGVRRGSHVTP